MKKPSPLKVGTAKQYFNCNLFENECLLRLNNKGRVKSNLSLFSSHRICLANASLSLTQRALSFSQRDRLRTARLNQSVFRCRAKICPFSNSIMTPHPLPSAALPPFRHHDPRASVVHSVSPSRFSSSNNISTQPTNKLTRTRVGRRLSNGQPEITANFLMTVIYLAIM